MTIHPVSIENLETRFGDHVLHQNLNLQVNQGEILGVVGGSGTGKTILMRTVVGLTPLKKGDISIFGHSLRKPKSWSLIKSRWGVMFQGGGLFSSMTVGENIGVPLKEIAGISSRLLIREVVALKIKMVGLPPETVHKYPAELSGGMIKRVALARALALDAELLFLDEPTAGLDPISAAAFDGLIKSLTENLNLTVVMITHDLDSLHGICDRVAVLVDKKIVVAPLQQLKKDPHPWIQTYFSGARGRNIDIHLHKKDKE